MSKKSGLSKPMEEAQRRAAILRRYDAEPLRTGEDDERFAKELGVAVQTFHQLIRSWRRYREPKMLPGARTRATAADREAAIDAAAKPDLSNVDPARRPLVRKRIKVLRRYLALETPTPVDEAAAAEELGMSLGSFHRLRRSWTMSRDPATLPGGSTPATLKDRRRPAIGAQAEACIAAVIEDLGPQATTVAIYREVAARCKSAGIKKPSQGSVYSRTVRARRVAPPDPRVSGMVVDHVALDIAVEHPDGPRLPVLSVIMELPTGRIVRLAASLEAPSAKSTAAFLADFIGSSRMSAAKVVPLQIGIPRGPEWDNLANSLRESVRHDRDGIRRNLLSGRALSQFFGQHFGRMKMRPGATTNPSRARLRKLGGGSSPISLHEASKAIEEIVERHNEGRRFEETTFVLPDEGERLCKSLKRLHV